jgi:hypoxanthine-DNA glycosylase
MSMAENAHQRTSFPPQAARDCRVLVLGSMPGERSLAERRYYAHPQNLFWPFMGELCGAGPDLGYAARIARLKAAGIGVWDVLESCERPGSLDGRIVRASEVANDLPALIARRPRLRAIALNGAKAAQAFRAHVLRELDDATLARLTLLALPSTSPAHASMPRAQKLARWMALRAFL